MANAKNGSSRERPLIKQGVILDTLRGQIKSGKLAPESRLPLRTQLEKTFQVSSVTLQRALDRLTRDGYIYARGKAGTFVAKYPPHLYQYGLVFPHSPTEEGGWLHYWSALCKEAQNVTQQGQRRLVYYYGLGEHQSSEDYQKLLRDLANHRLAGLLLASPLQNLLETPVYTTPNLPRVVMADTSFGFPAVNVDKRSFATRALDYLTGQGCRRIAVLDGAAMFRQPSERLYWLGELARRGVNSGSHWVQAVDVTYPQCAISAVELLFYSGNSHRPDALIIADDNLVESATTGLLHAGVKTADQVKIVAHCNFPWPKSGALPTKRLGFDMREWLQACFECMDQQRHGHSPLSMQRVPARFEEELALPKAFSESPGVLSGAAPSQ